MAFVESALTWVDSGAVAYPALHQKIIELTMPALVVKRLFPEFPLVEGRTATFVKQNGSRAAAISQVAEGAEIPMDFTPYNEFTVMPYKKGLRERISRENIEDLYIPVIEDQLRRVARRMAFTIDQDCMTVIQTAVSSQSAGAGAQNIIGATGQSLGATGSLFTNSGVPSYAVTAISGATSFTGSGLASNVSSGTGTLIGIITSASAETVTVTAATVNVTSSTAAILTGIATGTGITGFASIQVNLVGTGFTVGTYTGLSGTLTGFTCGNYTASSGNLTGLGLGSKDILAAKAVVEKVNVVADTLLLNPAQLRDVMFLPQFSLWAQYGNDNGSGKPPTQIGQIGTIFGMGVSVSMVVPAGTAWVISTGQNFSGAYAPMGFFVIKRPLMTDIEIKKEFDSVDVSLTTRYAPVVTYGEAICEIIGLATS